MDEVSNNKFDSQNKNKLSILISQDGLYFCIANGDRILHFWERKYSTTQSPQNLLKELKAFFNNTLNEDVLSSLTQLKVLYAHPLYTLVPQSYFDENSLSDYLKYNIRLLPTDELTFDRLTSMKSNVVYIPYTNINNFLIEKFGEFTYKHVISDFIDQCSKISKETSSDVLTILNVYATHFDMSVFKEDQLLLCNTYNYYSPEDFVYYVLFVFEQLRIDAETVKLKISGALDKESDVFNLLYNYVRHISFLKKKDKLIIEDSELKAKSSHTYQFLLNTI